jgi:hypothetical protein
VGLAGVRESIAHRHVLALLVSGLLAGPAAAQEPLPRFARWLVITGAFKIAEN